MSMRSHMHRPQLFEAHETEGTSWLEITDDKNNMVCVFLPYDTARGIARIFNENHARDRTPEPAR